MSRTALLGVALAGVLAASGSLAACSGDIGDVPIGAGPTGGGTGGGGGGDPLNDPTFAPAAGGIRRLVRAQYTKSIRVLLGDVAAAAAVPPGDSQLHGFDAIGGAELALPDAAVEQYEVSARAVAEAFVADQASMSAVVPCAPTGPGDTACFTQFLTKLGRVAWRRPLVQAEIDRLVAVATTNATTFGTWNDGAKYAIEAVLQSPYFLYIVEVGAPDPDDATRRKLSAGELATRMSFFLAGQTPDGALLDQADGGALDTPDGLRAAARALLKLPEAHGALADFYDELFRLRELPDLAKDAMLFPTWTPALKDAMRQETLLLIDDVVWQKNTDARGLLDSPYTFVNADLAALYDVTPPASGFEMRTLPGTDGRGGLLGHASILSRFAHTSTTSPTRRGLFVRTMLLCQDIPPPPPNVNTTLPPDDPMMPQTMRQKLEAHENNPSCAACHKLMDPIGLSLENFDAIGAYRTLDQGLMIDPNETVDGIGTFASPAELGKILHGDPRVSSCMMKNLFRGSMGHMETAGEKPALDALDAAFAKDGYKLQDLLVELVASPAFMFVGEPK